MTEARTGDQALVREINLAIILNKLRDYSPISRATVYHAILCQPLKTVAP